jgi:hypothetical protein
MIEVDITNLLNRILKTIFNLGGEREKKWDNKEAGNWYVVR